MTNGEHQAQQLEGAEVNLSQVKTIGILMANRSVIDQLLQRHGFESKEVSPENTPFFGYRYVHIGWNSGDD